MDINGYSNAFYCRFDKYIHLIILVIFEFYRIFLNIIIMDTIINKPLQNHIVNDKIDKIREIIMKYQLKKQFMTLYIQIKMVLLEMLLNIFIRQFRTWTFILKLLK